MKGATVGRPTTTFLTRLSNKKMLSTAERDTKKKQKFNRICIYYFRYLSHARVSVETDSDRGQEGA